jgi:hypothetical protein
VLRFRFFGPRFVRRVLLLLFLGAVMSGRHGAVRLSPRVYGARSGSRPTRPRTAIGRQKRGRMLATCRPFRQGIKRDKKAIFAGS